MTRSEKKQQKNNNCCLLPASLRVANLFLHANGLTEEAVNVFEIHAAVRHALHGTAKTSRSMKVLAVVTVGFCKIRSSMRRLTCMHILQCRWLLDSAPPSSAYQSA